MKQALHDRIRSDFETRIRAGRLKPGDRLPIEHDLVEKYGCSRMTVNKALSALVAAGLLERRKRAGTFVARPRMLSMVLEEHDILADIRGRGQTYSYRPLKQLLRAPRNDEERQLASGKKVLQLDGMHLADGTPFGLERRVVNFRAVPGILEVDFHDIPPGTWMLAHNPWTETETRVSATLASGETATLLQVQAGAACLHVERRTWRKAERFSYAQQIFRQGAYELVMRFTPGSSALSQPATPKKSQDD